MTQATEDADKVLDGDLDLVTEASPTEPAVPDGAPEVDKPKAIKVC